MPGIAGTMMGSSDVNSTSNPSNIQSGLGAVIASLVNAAGAVGVQALANNTNTNLQVTQQQGTGLVTVANPQTTLLGVAQSNSSTLLLLGIGFIGLLAAIAVVRR